MTNSLNSELSNATITWEQELDQMGTDASVEALTKHLEKAPSDAPSLEFLSGFLSGKMAA